MITVIVLLLALVAPQGRAAGIYDPEIAQMREHFGAYIKQSEKNIQALTRVSTAYERVGDAMESVVNVKHQLQGRCATQTKERLVDCLGRQFSAITLLALYVRHGNEIMDDSIADVKEAGRILGQNVSHHVAKFESIADNFKLWRDITIPLLKKQFEADRTTLAQVYGAEFVADYRINAQVHAARNEAALLAQEIAHAGEAIVLRGDKLLAEHRLAHAKFTLQSMRWLQSNIPNLWSAIDPAVKHDERVVRLMKTAAEDFSRSVAAYESKIEKRDPLAERAQALALLKVRVAEAIVSPHDREAFGNLFASISTSKDVFTETLIERGFVWLAAVKQ